MAELTCPAQTRAKITGFYYERPSSVADQTVGALFVTLTDDIPTGSSNTRVSPCSLYTLHSSIYPHFTLFYTLYVCIFPHHDKGEHPLISTYHSLVAAFKDCHAFHMSTPSKLFSSPHSFLSLPSVPLQTSHT